jgi:Lrp/AsnC family transcriptional regulator for asnA, asnC and gidA
VSEEYQIDSVDQKILDRLLKNARMPFLEIARELTVSNGTIHQRVERMEKAGIIKGYQAVIDRRRLGYGVAVLVGIHLKNAKDTGPVLEAMRGFPEIVETHFTTGNYALMAKVVTTTIQEFHAFLTGKLQALKEIQATESYICLDTPTDREIQPKALRK